MTPLLGPGASQACQGHHRIIRGTTGLAGEPQNFQGTPHTYLSPHHRPATQSQRTTEHFAGTRRLQMFYMRSPYSAVPVDEVRVPPPVYRNDNVRSHPRVIHFCTRPKFRSHTRSPGLSVTSRAPCRLSYCRLRPPSTRCARKSRLIA